MATDGQVITALASGGHIRCIDEGDGYNYEVVQGSFSITGSQVNRLLDEGWIRSSNTAYLLTDEGKKSYLRSTDEPGDGLLFAPQKWNNRANQLAIEGQNLRQRLAQAQQLAETRSDLIAAKAAHVDKLQSQLAQVTQEPLAATIDLLEQRRRQLGAESIPEYARTINFLQAIIDEKKKEYPPLRATGSNHEP